MVQLKKKSRLNLILTNFSPKLLSWLRIFLQYRGTTKFLNNFICCKMKKIESKCTIFFTVKHVSMLLTLLIRKLSKNQGNHGKTLNQLMINLLQCIRCSCYGEWLWILVTLHTLLLNRMFLNGQLCYMISGNQAVLFFRAKTTSILLNLRKVLSIYL